MSRHTRLAIAIAAVLGIPSISLAQAGPGDDAGGPPQRGFRGFFNGRMADPFQQVKEDLRASDEEWLVIGPKLREVMSLRSAADTDPETISFMLESRGGGFGGGFGGPRGAGFQGPGDGGGFGGPGGPGGGFQRGFGRRGQRGGFDGPPDSRDNAQRGQDRNAPARGAADQGPGEPGDGPPPPPPSGGFDRGFDGPPGAAPQARPQAERDNQPPRPANDTNTPDSNPARGADQARPGNFDGPPGGFGPGGGFGGGFGGRGGFRGGPGGRPPGGPGGPGGPGANDPTWQARTDLNAALNDKDATPEQIQAKVDALRAARQKAVSELQAAEKDLRLLLTPDQQAMLASLGYLD